MFRKIRLAAALAVIIPGLTGNVLAAGDSPAPVPAEYKVLYSQLDGWLDVFDARLAKSTAGEGTSPVWGVHLSAADSNRGDFLAGPTAAVQADLMLDMMTRLGVKGITIVIGNPLLTDGFPYSDQYRKFYQSIVAKVRERGLGLTIEQTLLMSNSELSPWKHATQALEFDALVDTHRQMAQWIIDYLQPDNLTLVNEPQSFAAISGRAEFLVEEGLVAFIEQVTTGLQRKTTRIGAGVSNWEAPRVASALVATPIDYLSLSFFDAAPASVDRAFQIADIASKANKPLIIGEAWLYKSSGVDQAQPDSIEGLAEGFRRNAFAFWAPLDQRFLDALMAFARQTGAQYVSPFWGNYMLAYLDYGADNSQLPFDRLVLDAAARKASSAVMSGWLSPTGKHYQKALAKP